jgi:8-oxo-dGTP diphosphatase
MVKELADQCVLVYPKRAKVRLARHKRGPFKGKLSGYGGDIEENDGSPRAAACREFEQESTATIRQLDDLQYLGVVYFYRKGRCITCFVYTVEKWEGELKETEEMGQPVSYSLRALPFHEMTEGDRHWLPQLLQGDKAEYHVYHNDDWTFDRVERREYKAA